MFEPGPNSTTVHMAVAVDSDAVLNRRRRRQSDHHLRLRRRRSLLVIHHMAVRERERFANLAVFVLLKGVDLSKPFFVNTRQCLQFLHRQSFKPRSVQWCVSRHFLLERSLQRVNVLLHRKKRRVLKNTFFFFV